MVAKKTNKAFRTPSPGVPSSTSSRKVEAQALRPYDQTHARGLAIARHAFVDYVETFKALS